MGVSPNGWFISWKIPLKWMIWEYPYSRKPPCGCLEGVCTASPGFSSMPRFSSHSQLNPHDTSWYHTAVTSAGSEFCIYTLRRRGFTSVDSVIFCLHICEALCESNKENRDPSIPSYHTLIQPNPHRQLWLQATLTTAQVVNSTFEKKHKSGTAEKWIVSARCAIQNSNSVWIWQSPTFNINPAGNEQLPRFSPSFFCSVAAEAAPCNLGRAGKAPCSSSPVESAQQETSKNRFRSIIISIMGQYSSIFINEPWRKYRTNMTWNEHKMATKRP